MIDNFEPETLNFELEKSMKLALERQIQLVFIIALLLLLIIGFFAYRSANSMTEALAWEKHTQAALLKLDDTLILATETENGGRGFVITGSESYLEPFNRSEQKIDQNIAELRQLISDNPKQTAEISRLENLTSEKIAFTKNLIETRRAQDLKAASDIIENGQGKQISDDIRLSIAKMKNEEQSLLKSREDDLDKSIGNTLFVLFFGTAAGILSLGLANFAVYRTVKQRRTSEGETRVANRDLEKRVEERTRELSQRNEELNEQIKRREQSELRRRIALEAGNLGTWTLDPKNNKAEIDERSLILFGLGAEDFDGSREKAFSRIYEEDHPLIEELFQKSLAERKHFNAKFRVKMPDGSIRWNHCIGQPQFDENGEIIHFVGHCNDITENKEYEEVLLEREHFNRSILDSLSAHIAVIDKKGKIIAVNEAWENFAESNCAEEQISSTGVGNNYLAVCEKSDAFDEDTKKIIENLRSVLTGELNNFVFEYPCHSPQEERWFFLQVNAMRGADGGAVVSHIDISGRKKAEADREEFLKREQAARKEAEIANRMRDEFLATVSHELRAPLNSILGWGRLLEKGNLDDATTAKAIKTIVRNAESQNRLIEDLLDVSRIISGKLRLEVMTIKPINLVKSALETVRPAAEAKGITLEIKEDVDVSHISGDPNRLQQVIWNLLSNAIKFTPNDGKVTLEIERSADFVELKVKDTGVGIKEEFLPHVFDRFRQADASSIRKFGGLGLGLAIVRHITEMHGGTVSVFSEGEGKGSTFTVKLPLITSPSADEEAERVKKIAASENSFEVSLDGLLILVVDDEEDTRQLLVQVLTFQGATVISANSVEHALEEIEGKNPDVLVSDIGMPDEDGYSLIRKVRALPDEQQRNIPAIALTAFTRAQDRMRALSSGFQSHVSKPVEPDELATVIASLTGRLDIDLYPILRRSE